MDNPQSAIRNPQSAVGLLLCDDMIFTSRITGTGSALGLVLKPARSPEALLALARQEAPRCVILDLSNPGLDVGGLINRLRDIGGTTPFVAAFGSHVDTATLRRAREAGCNVVWPRSKFFEELPQALPRWFAGEPEG